MKTLKFKSLKDIPKLEALGVQIQFEAQECDIDPADTMEDEDCINQVIASYNNGNAASWFTAKVTVTYKGMEEDDYLGGCSYKSFREFTSEKNGYYRDMIDQCIDGINKEIEDYNQSICRRWTIRKAKNLIAPYGLFIVSSKEVQEVAI